MDHIQTEEQVARLDCYKMTQETGIVFNIRRNLTN